MHRRNVIFGAAIVATVAAAAGVALAAAPRGPEPLAERVNPLLPDLVMAPINYVDGAFGEDLRPFLRFGATISNIGAGDFILDVRRSWPVSDDWVVTQRIPEAGGGFTERETLAGMIFGGDRHEHWHVRDIEEHRLERIDTGEVLARVVKQGFCFFDVTTVQPPMDGAPTTAQWPEEACGDRISTSLLMGLSAGWSDVYPPEMLEQHIELEGVPDGRYRIREIADPLDLVEELDETNNETWVDVEITTTNGLARVTIVGRPDDS